MSCLTLPSCCLYKCTVGKCAYSSSFVYNSLTRRGCWRVLEGCFVFFAKSLGLATMLLNVFLPITVITQTLEKVRRKNISGWTQSAAAQGHAHTHAIKTSPVLIFRGLSVGLPLLNPIRETQGINGSIKGFSKSLWRSTLKTSQLKKCNQSISLDLWSI